MNAGRSPGEPRVIALFGPTGVGKTEVAVELGRLLSGGSKGASRAVAINCDSMQVYAGLGLVAGAPRDEQVRELEHRLVGFVPLVSEFSAGQFGDLARKEIDAVLAEGRWPILAGGTGLYMRAALTELPLAPQVPRNLEEEIESEVEAVGLGEVHRALPADVGREVHPNDRKRIVRYTALVRMGIRPAPAASGGGELWSAPFRRPTAPFGLVMDRPRLAERIGARVEEMARRGAVEEARAALGAPPSRTAAKAIGLEEFARGDLDATVQRHLAFARRQETWLRRMEGVTVIERDDLSDRDVAERIFESLDSPTGLEA